MRRKGGPSPRLRKWAARASPLLQGTAAATAAWVIAKHVVHHHEPFFAPISAVIALNTSLGQRGLNTLRLLLGVMVGIVAGELTNFVLGGGYGSLALATFAAMAVARGLGGARIVIGQAAASAILTVAVAHGDVGLQRLSDALIGAGVALVFSQFLTSPEPVGLLRRAEAAALEQMADALHLTAQVLEDGGDEISHRVISQLRERLADVDRLRHESIAVARHSVVWRSRMSRARGEKEAAGYLDPLGVSCLMLMRTAMATTPPERQELAPSIRDLAGALANLAGDHADRATRQRAADRALEIARRNTADGTSSEPTLAAIIALRTAANDVMVFAGVDPAEAATALHAPAGNRRVAVVPPSPSTSPLQQEPSASIRGPQ